MPAELAMVLPTSAAPLPVRAVVVMPTQACCFNACLFTVSKSAAASAADQAAEPWYAKMVRLGTMVHAINKH